MNLLAHRSALLRWFLTGCGLVLGTGCVDTGFADRSIVAQWRALAIVADPPEIRPADSLRLRAMVVRPDGQPAVHGEDNVVFRWSVCAREERVPGLSGAQFDPEQTSQACGAATDLPVPTDPDGSATVTVANLFEGLDAALTDETLLATAAALGVPAELVEQVIEQSGLPLVTQLLVCEVSADESCQPGSDTVRVVAFKRIIVTTRQGQLQTNPDPPRFRICPRDGCGAEQPADDWIRAATSEEGFRCEAENEDLAPIPVDQEIVLDPEDVSLVPGEDTWIERYRVLDLRGEFIDVNERAYYSWFSTDGAFDQEITRAPFDEEIWRTPETPGTYPLWLVVRDGHGGTSACRVELNVGR